MAKDQRSVKDKLSAIGTPRPINGGKTNDSFPAPEPIPTGIANGG